jgi:hypothetical protein
MNVRHSLYLMAQNSVVICLESTTVYNDLVRKPTVLLE